MHYVFLSLAFILNALANILLKIGAKNGFQLNNFVAIAGLILFAVNVIFYFMALRTIPISTAYPVMVIMSFLIINGAAYFFLDEQIHVYQVAGYFLIVVGLILVFRFSELNLQ